MSTDQDVAGAHGNAFRPVVRRYDRPVKPAVIVAKKPCPVTPAMLVITMKVEPDFNR